MAGNSAMAAELCLNWYAERGGCVTVTPTKYVYTGGQEDGFIIGFINYPPHISNEDKIMKEAQLLAELLRVKLGQESYTIQGPTHTITYGR